MVAWIVAAIVLCGAGFGARSLIDAPEDAVLPVPEPEAVYVPVESRTVASTFTGSGAIEVGRTTEVTYSGQGGGVNVVTSSPLAPGDELEFCEPLLEISGRPVIAMHGPVVAYRDIGEGDAGDDVLRLQEALAECGYAVAPDGRFGAQTAAVVRALYEEIGYAIPTREGEVSASEEASVEGTGSENAQEEQQPDPVSEVVVPAAEVAFISERGWLASAATLNAQVGTDPIVTVEHGRLSFSANLSAAAMLAVGDDETISIEIGSSVEEFGLPDLPGAPTFTDDGEPVYPIVVQLPEDADTALAGTSAIYTITAGDETVHPHVVPVSALYSEADGSSFVIRRVGADEERTTATPVTVVAAGDGYVAVEGDLTEGDNVQVGWQ